MLGKGMSLGVVLGVMAAALLAVSAPVQGTDIIEVIDLGTLGGTESRAYGLNASGDVTGSYMVGGSNHAFVWHDADGDWEVDAGEMQDLGTLGGGRSVGRAINDAGQVTGWADLQTLGNYRAFVWTDTDGDWQGDPGEMVNLGTLGITSGTHSVGYDINNAGQVTGISYLDAAFTKRRSFRYTDLDSDGVADPGEMRNMGTLGGQVSQGFGINTAGNVVGLSTQVSGTQQTFRWIDGDADNIVDPGEMVALVSPSTPSTGYEINDSGEIAGYFESGGVSHAYYYDPNVGMTDLHGLLGAAESWAYGVNDDGMVSGTYLTSGGDQHAFVYDPDSAEVTTLDDLLLAGSGWELFTARDIEGNMVCGWGILDGEVHAYLAIHTEGEESPEPVTLLLVGGGAMVLLRRRRRK